MWNNNNDVLKYLVTIAPSAEFQEDWWFGRYEQTNGVR